METSTPRPKPGPYKKVEPVKEEKPPVVKKPFIPKPHLTTRPFQASDGLRALQKEIHATQPKKNPRRNTPIKKQEKK